MKYSVKTPYLTMNLKKWREVHNLTSPEAEAYVQARNVQEFLMRVIYLFLGMMIALIAIKGRI